MLGDKLEEACAGHGGVVLLMGEPGIGKTRTVREFVGSVRKRGLPVFWGGCIESEAGPPYGPWAGALKAYTDSQTGAAHEPAVLSAQSIVGQLVPELRDRIPDVFRPAPLSAQEERARLQQAVHVLLTTVAHERGLILVLEDVHWADSDSLELLSSLARGVVDSRILIVVTYRDTDLALGASPHLVKVLGELHRLPECDSTRLLGLSRPEVGQLLRGAVEGELPNGLVDVIHADSDGNPFYARELCRYAVESGRLVGVPGGVRQVVDLRLARLSLDAQRVLKSACAFTGAFRLEALHALTGLIDERLLACLDEVMVAGVVRPADHESRRYEFTHAIVRHAVYEGLNPDRRARLHRQVAEALMHLSGDEPPDAAEIAAQFHAAAALPGSEQGVQYALAAANQARASHASEQSVVLLAMARDLARSSAASVRAEVLCRLALAEAESLRLADGGFTAEDALTALHDSGAEAPRIAEFIVGIARALKEGGADTAAWGPLVERGLALLPAERDLTWARLRLLQDQFEAVTGGVVSASRWQEHDPRAVGIARARGGEDDYAQTLETFDWRTPRQTADVLALARTWQQPTAIMRALNVVGRDMLFFHQDFAAATECGKELLATATRYGSISGQADALTLLASVRMVRGEWLLARQTVRRAEELVQRLGALHRLNPIVRVIMAGTFAYFLDDADTSTLARSAATLAAEQRVGRSSILGLLLGSVAALGYACSAEPDAARRLLEAVTPVLERMQPIMHHHNSAVQTGASAVWELDARTFAASYRRLALDLVAAGVGDTPHGCNELTVARMAACLGEVAEAGHWFARARQHLEATGQRPMRAMVDHDEALALLRWRSADSQRCAELIGAAEPAFAALGMTSWAHRSARLREQIRPSRRLDGLTMRELDVLRLLAGGGTTSEIAGLLVLSPGTVERHITHIYGKIGARGRADATAYALREGLA
jgi:DNA-binding CsgD family transcriptional regulator